MISISITEEPVSKLRCLLTILEPNVTRTLEVLYAWQPPCAVVQE
jgi:hypothetical protein